jgi:hypothetical protein
MKTFSKLFLLPFPGKPPGRASPLDQSPDGSRINFCAMDDVQQNSYTYSIMPSSETLQSFSNMKMKWEIHMFSNYITIYT